MGGSHNRSGGAHNQGVCGYGVIYSGPHYSSYKKKEISTRVFKRTTRYDPIIAIGQMWSKIIEIQEGTYEAPRFRAFKGEIEERKKEEEEKKKKAASAQDSTSTAVDGSQDYYDEMNPYGYLDW